VIRRFLVLIVYLSVIGATLAQESGSGEVTLPAKNGIAAVRYMHIRGGFYIRVDFTKPAAGNNADISPANLVVEFPGSHRAIPQTAIATPAIPHGPTMTDTEYSPGFGNMVAQIGVDNALGAAEPVRSDQTVSVTFHQLHFQDGTVGAEVTGLGQIYDHSNIDLLVESTRKALAVAKPKDEKDIFVGLNVDVPSGNGNNAQGSTDLVLNHTFYAQRSTVFPSGLFDSALLGLKLKKASQSLADARHFEAGFKLRKTFLLASSSDVAVVRNAVGGNVSPGALAALGRLQSVFFRSVLWDNGLQFEGDVGNGTLGNVSNLVYDSELQLASISRGFAAQTGFWNLRFMPVGVEAGYNLKTSDTRQERGSLARYKAGAVLNLHYQSKSPGDFLSRIELEASTVNRYLFQHESALDQKTQQIVSTTRGNHNWVEADLKFFLGAIIGKTRPGLKISYTRGSLPPVYSYTKAFQVGIVFESADDDTSKR